MSDATTPAKDPTNTEASASDELEGQRLLYAAFVAQCFSEPNTYISPRTLFVEGMPKGDMDWAASANVAKNAGEPRPDHPDSSIENLLKKGEWASKHPYLTKLFVLLRKGLGHKMPGIND